MDFVGLRKAGLMDQSIQPLWININDFSHRICGIAVTARYVPNNKVIQNPMPETEYALNVAAYSDKNAKLFYLFNKIDYENLGFNNYGLLECKLRF
jgi:hypothetical protein